jgi:perosamine synthetase
MTVFSFHPVKHITTGEGGMITTGDPRLAERMRAFRNHGIYSDFRQREEQGSWYYEMEALGYNYRITDIQCALGLSQLAKLPGFIRRRRQIAAEYDRAFSDVDEIAPLRVKEDIEHAYHLYVVKIDFPSLGIGKKAFFRSVRLKGVGMNVHYIPVYLHPFYRDRFGTVEGICPSAEDAYEKILSLPIYPAMKDEEGGKVVSVLCETLEELKKGPENGDAIV